VKDSKINFIKISVFTKNIQKIQQTWWVIENTINFVPLFEK